MCNYFVYVMLDNTIRVSTDSLCKPVALCEGKESVSTLAEHWLS